MSVTVDLPPATLRRLEAEAARRGVGIDVVMTGLAGALPAEDTGEVPARRRRLAIAGIGASGGQRGRAADARTSCSPAASAAAEPRGVLIVDTGPVVAVTEANDPDELYT
ncbi:MAG: hypothetical protein JJU45_00265 [Acidimicrobiia bacterium]|nr:hypothetical protein [Acidimicrobiia bacterium]